MKYGIRFGMIAAVFLFAPSCQQTPSPDASRQTAGETHEMTIPQRLAQYTTVKLTSDLAPLSDQQRRMIVPLIKAATLMNDIFWKEAYGDKDQLLKSASDPDVRRYLEINYGPWDRLRGDEAFLPGVGPKPPGANFYPSDVTREEVQTAIDEEPDRAAALKGLYTLVRRDSAGKLEAIPYHQAFAPQVKAAAKLLQEAAGLAQDPGFKHYLELRAKALLDDDYRASDLAWMDMKDNSIDIVIGPIETYEDQLFGYKAAHEAFVLIKDKEWSRRLARYIQLLPQLQRELPVADQYKKESPGTNSDLNAYDAVFYAGDANAGAKTIAINLPNDEKVQLQKGTRRLQLKNAMRAKFDKILLPIADHLIADDQRSHVTFDAFFANTMFHEVAHGLGIKNTINGRGTVREALKEKASALEEGKADVLGLFMVHKLAESGELPGTDVQDNDVTFLASIFRSVRFGASDAHGRANLARFNFFKQMGAFSRDEATGKYRVDFQKMQEAMNALSEKILRFQGDGDYAGVVQFMKEMSVIGPELQKSLNGLASAGIPVDIVFDQGTRVLGLDASK